MLFPFLLLNLQQTAPGEGSDTPTKTPTHLQVSYPHPVAANDLIVIQD